MPTPFLDFLVNQKDLTANDAKRLEDILRDQNKTIDSVLLEAKIDATKLLDRKAKFFHLPPVDFATQAIEASLLELFPQEIINNYQVIPFAFDENTINVAIVSPENLKAREAVEFISRQKGWNTQFYVTTELGLKQALEQYSNLSKEVEEALSLADKNKQDKGTETFETASDGKFEEVVKSAPVSKMVDVILRHAVEGGASDIHIEPSDQQSRVRYRIDGRLRTTLTLPRYIHASIVSRIKVLANLKLDETRKPQDGRIRVNFGGHRVDLRVSTFPLMSNEKVVMRILDVSRGAPTLADLGFIDRNLAVIEKNIHQPHGLFLVTGPTGSGKSTTLFSVLTLLNEEGVNIVTLEDPVEYYLAGANQAAVRPEVGFTFASGLRSILRQDPDVIMVGEIRDNETAELAIQAALTGHIVLSTLHTNDATGAIPRLMDMQVEPFLLASTINVLVAQRLVRKLCQQCREPGTPAPDLLALSEKILSTLPAEVVYKGLDKTKPQFFVARGCAKCGDSGYAGRLAICEVLENTNNLKDIILRGFKMSDLNEEMIKQGFTSMSQDGIMKAMQGLTTLEEIVMATKE